MAAVSARSFPASGSSPGSPLHPPFPLEPGADFALAAACSPVTMTTGMTSAPGLNITVRTPNQLNANNAFLIVPEIFLVPKKKKKGIWGDG